MNKTFSLSQLSETGNFDSYLILREYKNDLMVRFMGTESMNPNLRQD